MPRSGFLAFGLIDATYRTLAFESLFCWLYNGLVRDCCASVISNVALNSSHAAGQNRLSVPNDLLTAFYTTPGSLNL